MGVDLGLTEQGEVCEKEMDREKIHRNWWEGGGV